MLRKVQSIHTKNARFNESGVFKKKKSHLLLNLISALAKKNKHVSKGVCIHQNPLIFDNCLQANDKPLSITNRQFCNHQHRIFSYAQTKKDLNSFYPKRIVMDNDVHTKPLKI